MEGVGLRLSETFNSLSRDHTMVAYTFKRLLPNIAFNSLSRDHTGDAEGGYRTMKQLFLSTPSLGITCGDIDE